MNEIITINGVELADKEYKSSGGSKTEDLSTIKDVEFSKIFRKLNKSKEEDYKAFGNLTFVSFCDTWLNFQKEFIKHSTFCNYKQQITKHLKVYFSKHQLRDFENTQIQMFVVYLKKEKNLGNRSIEGIVSVLKLILRFAMENNLIRSFSLKTKMPVENIEENKIKLFSPEDVEKIKLFEFKDKKMELSINLLFYTGIRNGEACALRWSDIDFNKKTISVKRTAQRVYAGKGVKTKVEVGLPKTKSSIRKIPINEKLLKMLKKYKNDDVYVIGGDKPTDPRTNRNIILNFCNECEIDSKSPHAFRHTFATTLINNGVDLKTVSELLGHASVQTTIDVYVHTSDTARINAIEML